MKHFPFPALLLLLLAACTDGPASNDAKYDPGTGFTPPANLSYSIVNTFPHDTSSYTQGLTVYNGEMYEGTGNYGRSHLMVVDISTGKPKRKVPLDPKYFGEGITILRDTLYQLTWRENLVFVYSLKDFKKIREFRINTEGWGITTDGSSLIVTDGSSNLYYYEPSSFTLLRTQGVSESGSPADSLNELEYIDGFIYANQYQRPYIFKIDPATGNVVAKADLKKLWERVTSIDPKVDVPNGIAHDPATGKTYITGKLWPELYQIEFGK